MEAVDALTFSLKKCQAMAQCYAKLDFDAIFITDYTQYRPNWIPEFIDDLTYIDEWGRRFKVSEKALTTWWIPPGPINTPEDLDAWESPDPEADGRYTVFEKIIKDYGEEYFIVGYGHDAWQFAWELRGGMDKMIIDMVENPKFVQAIIDRVTEINLGFLKGMADAGADMITVGDDYSDAHGPLLHPRLLKQFVFPGLRRIVQTFRKRGLPVMKHSDGNCFLIMDDLIDIGITGFDPNEPGCNDIGVMKEKYGDKLFLMGDVDCRTVLPLGTPEDTRRDVQEAIDLAGEGGGLVLASSNSFHSDVKVENLRAFADECRKYGKYPLKKR
jgi:uroporphyrinogen decarboxylase